MRVDAIEALGSSGSAAALEGPAKVAKSLSFGDWIKTQVTEADQASRTAEASVRSLALGESDNLHEVMLNLSRARMSVELVVQIRNRLLESYQEIARMQI